MKKIYKYLLNSDPIQSLQLPLNSKILTIGIQNNNFVAWASVNTNIQKMKMHQIYCNYTGEIIQSDTCRYITTLIKDELVYHFFTEIIKW